MEVEVSSIIHCNSSQVTRVHVHVGGCTNEVAALPSDCNHHTAQSELNVHMYDHTSYDNNSQLFPGENVGVLM